MDRFENQFEERLKALHRDSMESAIFAYTQFALDYEASNFEILDRLNQHPGFWNGLAGALQTAAFIALGRIFDDDKGTHSAQALLNFAEEHPGIFRKAALEARKRKAGAPPDVARERAAEAYELRRGALMPIREEFRKRQEFYRQKVAPIRHKVFAHAAMLDREEREKLFTDLFRRPLEDLVVFSLRLHRALSKLYHDGREPVLDDAPSNIGDVMKALPAPRTTTWEHLHTARDTAAFLEWLKRGPLEHD
jgi:hypothetical protein